MNKTLLTDIAKSLVAPGKGILAADESSKTIQKRFTKIGITSTPEMNLAYRSMLFGAPGIEQYISGVILYDETIRQKINGIPVPEYLESKGILPGIKVDKGAWKLVNFPEEKITEGLDNLRDRLTEYKELGAKFAKWRAVITIGDGIPTEAAILANAHSLALYAALCQEQDIVPIVEPEVLMDGTHDLKRCQEVTLQTLKTVYEQLKLYNVLLEGTLLKPNMVISGKDSAVQATAEEIAKATIDTLKEAVPAEVPGIVFLSGGQTPDQATVNLAAINSIGGPWQLSYSYGRALQDEALITWARFAGAPASPRGDSARRAGKKENIEAAQQVFLERLKKVSEARLVKPI